MVKQFLHSIMFYMGKSHRWSHLIGGFAVGLVFGFGAALCVAAALEFKDVQHDGWNQPEWAGNNPFKWRWACWDWVDFAITCVGGVIGSLVRWLVVGRFM